MPLPYKTPPQADAVSSPAKCRAIARFAAGILLLSLAACHDDPVGRTVPVKGKVTLDGEPLKTGSLVFWPDADQGNNGAFEAGAQIDKDGGFDLITRGKQGAQPGAYRVTVMAQVPIDEKNRYSQAKLLVPAAYTKKDTTPLRVEVVAHPRSGAYDLTIKRE